MRALALAALVVAMATPALAANDGDGGYRLCIAAGTSKLICEIKYAPSEGEARGIARAALVYCEQETANQLPWALQHCAETRAYIKQRWGYR